MSTADFAVNVARQHYIVPMLRSAMVLDDATTAAANEGALLSAWLDVTKAQSGNKKVTVNNDPFMIFVDSKTLTITNVALTSNVATITTSAVHGLVVGDTVKVNATTTTALNGTYVVKAAPTTTTFTYDKVNANISSTADTGSVITGVYPLDGTGFPIQLNSITGAPLSNSTNSEQIFTEDEVTKGSAVPVALSDTRQIAFKGVTVHKSITHKILNVLNEYTTAQGLGVKYLRVGPATTTEKTLAYGMLASKTEEGDASQTMKYSASLTLIGSQYTIYDNN